MSSSPTEVTLVEVTMPQMGVSVAEGTVVEWKKRVGDWVENDEPIVEISTDKVETEVPSPASGRVASIAIDPRSRFWSGEPRGPGPAHGATLAGRFLLRLSPVEGRVAALTDVRLSIHCLDVPTAADPHR